MARIIKEIEVDGKKLTALFDTGSNNTYIRKEFAPSNRIVLKKPLRVSLGGKTWEIREGCSLQGEIDGLSFITECYVIETLGEVDGKQLDVIIGARTMEGWELRLNPATGELDLSGLKRRDFVEY